MNITVSISDNISTALTRLTSAAAQRDLMQAIGVGMVSLTKRSFEEASLRPAAWPARTTEGGHALLKKSGTLQRSIAITALDDKSVSISSDRIYAAIHQFGGVIRPKKAGGRLAFSMGGRMVFAKSVTIPARPFFPLSGGLSSAAEARIKEIVRIKLQKLARPA